jgi:hypothetical protein
LGCFIATGSICGAADGFALVSDLPLVGSGAADVIASLLLPLGEADGLASWLLSRGLADGLASSLLARGLADGLASSLLDRGLADGLATSSLLALGLAVGFGFDSGASLGRATTPPGGMDGP